jgi:hypothetical protein
MKSLTTRPKAVAKLPKHLRIEFPPPNGFAENTQREEAVGNYAFVLKNG